MGRRFFLILLIGFATGCTYSVHQVQVSDFKPYRRATDGKLVKAQAEQFVILGFVSQTDYVDQALRQLIAGCPHGVVTGITTELSTAHGFFSWTNKVLMQGLCVGAVALNDAK